MLQVKVSLPNTSGQLLRVLTCFFQEGVHPRGVNVDRAGAFSEVMFVFSDKEETERAIEALYEWGYKVQIQDVLMFPISYESSVYFDQPFRVLEILAKHGINIEYVYAVYQGCFVLVIEKDPGGRSAGILELLATNGLQPLEAIPVPVVS